MQDFSHKIYLFCTFVESGEGGCTSFADLNFWFLAVNKKQLLVVEFLEGRFMIKIISRKTNVK